MPSVPALSHYYPFPSTPPYPLSCHISLLSCHMSVSKHDQRNDLNLKILLSLEQSYIFSLPAFRPSLYHEVQDMDLYQDAKGGILKLLAQPHLANSPGIIYCQTIDDSKDLVTNCLSTQQWPIHTHHKQNVQSGKGVPTCCDQPSFTNPYIHHTKKP